MNVDKSVNLVLNLIYESLDWLLKWLPLTLLIALSPGVTIGILMYRDAAPEFQTTNTMPAEHIVHMLPTVTGITIASILIVLALYATLALILKRTRHIPLIDSFRTLNRYGAIVTVLPLFLSLDADKLSRDNPFVAIVISAAIAAIIGIYVYRFPQVELKRLPLTPRRATAIALAAVSIAAILFIIQIFEYQLIHYHSLKMGNFDFGVYVNTLWNSAHGRFLRSDLVRGGYHIYAHFDPILVLFSPIMLIHPAGETALLTQTIWLALGAFPVFLISRHHLKNNWMPFIISVTYLIYPGMHGMAMYDFHSLALAGPLMLWSLYFIETRKFIGYFITLCLLLLTREDLSLIMSFVGFYIFYGEKQFRVGIATMALCMAYFAFAKLFVMASDDAYSYENYFDKLQVGNYGLAHSLVITAITNPVYLIQQGLQEHKLLYMLQLLMPLLMLPLLGKKRLITCAYGLIVTFLVSRKAVTQIAYQYPTFLYPFFFAMVPVVLKEIREYRIVSWLRLDSQKLITALVLALLASSVCISYNFGVFHETASFKAGHSKFNRAPGDNTSKRYESVQKLKNMIPPDASLSASLFIGAQFPTRETIFQFKNQVDTDYYVILDSDMKERHIRNKYKRFLKKNRYDLIFSEMNLKLFIRKDLNNGKYKPLRINR